jgi:hypothetical protein
MRSEGPHPEGRYAYPFDGDPRVQEEVCSAVQWSDREKRGAESQGWLGREAIEHFFPVKSVQLKILVKAAWLDCRMNFLM